MSSNSAMNNRPITTHNRRPPHACVHRLHSIKTRQFFTMPFVVTDSCILCKYTTCVDVCPMNCFREGPQFLVIAPDECIDCSLCVSECPVGAIYSDSDLPAHQRHFTKLNAELAAHADWKRITRSKAPLPDHDAWRTASKKLDLLDDNLLAPRKETTIK